MEPVPMADTVGTVVSFTIDKLVYSPSPPVVFAVVDFDGGGRAPLELADCGPTRSRSARVLPTFRRLFTADEIHNYFGRTGEGSLMGSHGIKDGRDHRHGLHALHRALGQVTRRPDHRRSPAHLCLRGHPPGRHRHVLVRHLAVRSLGARHGWPAEVHGKPITRVENYCTTGSRRCGRSLRRGVRRLRRRDGARGGKVKDGGYQGLNAFPIPTDGTQRTLTAAGMFSLILPAYAESTASTRTRSATRSPRSPRRTTSTGPAIRWPSSAGRPAPTICQMAAVAGRLSVFDCAGVADGAAAVIMCRAEDAHKYTDNALYVKALSFVAGTGAGSLDPDYDYDLARVQVVGRRRLRPGRRHVLRDEIAVAEVHDCFTPTELVLMEDLRFSDPGKAWRDVLDGAFRLDGRLPVNSDGGLKAFGHPVGHRGCACSTRSGSSCAVKRPRSGVSPTTVASSGWCTTSVGIPGDGEFRRDLRHRARLTDSGTARPPWPTDTDFGPRRPVHDRVTGRLGKPGSVEEFVVEFEEFMKRAASVIDGGIDGERSRRVHARKAGIEP